MNTPTSQVVRKEIRSMLYHLVDGNYKAAEESLSTVVKEKTNARYRDIAARVDVTVNK